MRILDLATLSLVGGSGVAEVKQPIWWADGTSTSTTQTSSGVSWLADGAGAVGITTSARQLFTFSSAWPSTEKVALEATIYTTSGGTAYVALWDFTSGTIVSSSQISTTATTATVIRSSQVSLTPSHSYGVTLWVGASNSYYCYVVDASLIIFP